LIGFFSIGPLKITIQEIEGAMRESAAQGSGKPFDDLMKRHGVSALARSLLDRQIHDYIRSNPNRDPSAVDDDIAVDDGVRTVGNAKDRDICLAIIYDQLQRWEYAHAERDLAELSAGLRGDSQLEWNERTTNVIRCFYEFEPENITKLQIAFNNLRNG